MTMLVDKNADKCISVKHLKYGKVHYRLAAGLLASALQNVTD